MLAFAGAGKASAGGGLAGAGAAAVAGGGGDGNIACVRCGGILAIGADGAACCKASFFLIMSSQSNCFSCSSAISLESTSFTRSDT